jgi:hypothetical protein
MKKVFLTVNCQGGLGNQLFQFIIGYILAKTNKINLRINIERYNSYDRQFELEKFPEIYKLNIPKIKKDNFFSIIYLYLSLLLFRLCNNASINPPGPSAK